MKLNKTITVFLLFIISLALGIFLFGILSDKNYFVEIKNFVEKLTIPQNTTDLEENLGDTSELKIYNLETVDNRAAEIYGTRYSFLIHSNKNIEIFGDKTFKKLYLARQDKENLYYVLELENIGEGNSKRTIEIGDQVGNKVIFTVNLKRIPFGLPFGMKDIPEWEDFKFSIKGNDLLALVDKKNKLLSEYLPIDLVDLNKPPYYLYTNTQNLMLRKEAADALKTMLESYKRDSGKNIVIASGFRQYDEQYRLYAYWVKELGIDHADRISARPGYSEHQLGTVVDFINQESGLELSEKFSTTEAFKWLTENAHKFGFVLSYPPGKEKITGYQFEPWHWRYIGIENAEKFRESSLTLNKWIEENAI